MGFRLHVMVRPGARARVARLKSDEKLETIENALRADQAKMIEAQ